MLKGGKRTPNETQPPLPTAPASPSFESVPKKIYRPLTRSINLPRIPSLSGALNGKTNLNLFAENGDT